MYKEYYYGEHRKEIRQLLRKRLMILERIRHHKKHLAEWEKKFPIAEKELNDLLEHAKSELKK